MKEIKDNSQTYKFSRKKAIFTTLIGVLAVAAIIGAAFGFYAIGVTYGETEISLHEGITFQTAKGFGASSAWVYQSLGKSENVELKNKAMDMLYGNDGLQLNTFRYNVGAGGSESDNYQDPLRGAESFFIKEKFNGDYSAFADVNNYDFSKDGGVMDLFKRALSLGNIRHVVFFANSPHYLMTKNGKTHADEKYQSNLKEECYGAFSDYMLLIVDYLYDNVIKEYGEDIAISISPVNEPQWAWGGADASQEGCHFSPQELAKFYDVFYDKLSAYNKNNSTDFRLDIFESGNYKITDAKARVKKYVAEMKKYEWFDDMDNMSVHSYGSGLDANVRKVFRNHVRNNSGCDISVSEYCVLKGGVDKSIDMGIYSARVISRDLDLLNATSWNYWLSVSVYDYEDGLVYWDGADELSVTKRYYAMGQFSKYIPAGSRKIKSHYSDSFGINGIDHVAFKRPDGSIALIVTNGSGKARKVRIKGGYEDVIQITTDDSANWEQSQYKFNNIITVPAKSISTYILTQPQEEQGK